MCNATSERRSDRWLEWRATESSGDLDPVPRAEHLERDAAGTAEPPEGVSAPEASSEPSDDSEVALELAFWNSVEDGNPAELATYLERYPDGTLASLARTRLDAAVSPASLAATKLRTSSIPAGTQ